MARPDNFVKVDGYTLPAKFDEEKLRNGTLQGWEFRADDAIIGGFPKSGNNWLVKVVQSMYSDWGLCEFGGRREPVLIDEHLLTRPMSAARGLAVEATDVGRIPSPRLMRTHLPATMVPLQKIKASGGKIIYVSRNPKDVCVSYFHFLKSFQHGALFAGNWEKAVQAFIQDMVPFAPWSKHVIEWFKFGVDDNVLHVTYEEMKEDLAKVIQKIARFLERPINDEDTQRVVSATTVEAMSRGNPLDVVAMDDEVVPKGQNPWVRKGVVGDWKNHFTVAQNELFETEIGEKLRDGNPDIPYQ